MALYYKHYKGNIYRFLHEAKHSESKEEFVIYQALYGNNEIWARPKDMFFGYVEVDGVEQLRFKEISKAEALSIVTNNDNFPPYFPDIKYTNEFGRLNDGIDIFSKSVRAMMTLLNDREIISVDLYDNLKTDDDIENKIFGMVLSEDYEDKLQDIFHLIQTWGGVTGRHIYIRGNGFNWDDILPKYKILVNECLKVKEVNENTISTLCQLVREIIASIKYLGVSFITKHVRFWLYRNLGKNALPIYDSIMAKTVMNKQSVQIWNLEEYWLQMYYKSLELKIDLMPLERQIFKYAFDRR